MAAREFDDSNAFTAWRDDNARRKKKAEQGKKSEDAVKKWLRNEEVLRGLTFAWERPVDSREAGGQVKAVTGDFNLFFGGGMMTLEVKETSFDWLPRANFERAQINRLQRRSLAGVPVWVIVHHSGLKLWRVCNIKPFFDQTEGRFETETIAAAQFGSAHQALAYCTASWFNR